MIEGFSIKELLMNEIAERRQEGYIVPEYALDGMDDNELEKLYDSFETLKKREDYPYYEPDGLENILAASTGCTYKKEPYADKLFPKFYGAWLARWSEFKPVYFALQHSSAASSSLRIRQYASFGFLAAKHRKTK